MLIGFFVIVSTISYSQGSIDYLKLRQEVRHFSCTSTDIDSIQFTLKELINIDTSRIVNGLYYYYKDLAMSYYLLEVKNESKDFKNAIKYFEKCVWLDKKVPIAYHNLYIIYTLKGEKKLAKEKLDLYNKYLKMIK